MREIHGAINFMQKIAAKRLMKLQQIHDEIKFMKQIACEKMHENVPKIHGAFYFMQLIT